MRPWLRGCQAKVRGGEHQRSIHGVGQREKQGQAGRQAGDSYGAGGLYELQAVLQLWCGQMQVLRVCRCNHVMPCASMHLQNARMGVRTAVIMLEVWVGTGGGPILVCCDADSV